MVLPFLFPEVELLPVGPLLLNFRCIRDTSNFSFLLDWQREDREVRGKCCFSSLYLLLPKTNMHVLIAYLFPEHVVDFNETLRRSLDTVLTTTNSVIMKHSHY